MNSADLLINTGAWPRKALILGIVLVAVSAVFLILNPGQFLQSYLIAFLYCLGPALGSLAILMLHQLTGGRWGASVRRPLESATLTLPMMIIFFIPVLIGTPYLYVWMDQNVLQKDVILQHKHLYLNFPFFVLRAAIYFALWNGLAFLFHRLSMAEDENRTPELESRFQRISGLGLLLYGLTATFAAIDWIMSLEPHWYSTIYGLLILTGQVLSGFAFVIAVTILLGKIEPFSRVYSPELLHDLGNLLLAFVMLWAYLSFSQLLIIWSGNLPEEIPWYVHRLQTGWQTVGILLLLFHFALPFVLLLSRFVKKGARTLMGVAIGILVMRWVDLVWLIGPEFHPKSFYIHPLDLILPLGLLAIWISIYMNQLQKYPIIPVHDPNLAEVLHHE